MALTNNDSDNPSMGGKRPQRESQAETSSQENGSSQEENSLEEGKIPQILFLIFLIVLINSK